MKCFNDFLRLHGYLSSQLSFYLSESPYFSVVKGSLWTRETLEVQANVAMPP